MARLFISYRRTDTGAYTTSLKDVLAGFQFDSVFLDRDDIALSSNFGDRIRAELGKCDAVLVLIGKSWLQPDAAGKRRIDDVADMVHREISIALAIGKPVFPVLFDGARMPAASEVPDDLAALASTNAYEINGNYLQRDVTDLASRIEKALTQDAAAEAPVTGGSTLVQQLGIIWILLALVTTGVSIAPFFVPAIPRLFWIFPGTMTLASFSWWLYWLGQVGRLRRVRLA